MMEQQKREKKEKKEESNKVKVLRLLLIFVVFVFVVAYFSGAWNPFKSQEVSEEATALYEKSEETMKDIYDKVDKVRGMDIIFVTTAKTDEEARELLTLFNMPFQK